GRDRRRGAAGGNGGGDPVGLSFLPSGEAAMTRWRLALGVAFFDITPHGPESRARHRRPLGVRLWLADVAAGLSVCRARRGATRRRASGALRLFFRPPRDARAARPRAPPPPRRGPSGPPPSPDRRPPRPTPP